MLSLNVADFQLFGDGEDLVFVMDKGLFVMRNALITSASFNMDMSIVDVTSFDSVSNYRKHIPRGAPEYSATFDVKPEQVEHVLKSGDPFQLLNRYRDKTIRELLQIVNQKIEQR